MTTIAYYLGILDASMSVLSPFFQFVFYFLIVIIVIMLLFGIIRFIKWVAG